MRSDIKNYAIWLITLVSISIVATFYYFYLRLTNIDFDELLKIRMNSLILTALLIIIAETVKVIRLWYIFREIGIKTRIKTIFISRFFGDLMGFLTPSNIGSEPSRAAVIATLEGIPIEGIMAGCLLESFYDSLILISVSFIASIFYLPASILVLLSSITVILIWVLIFIGVIFKESIVTKLIEKILQKYKKISYKYVESFTSRYKEFRRLVKVGIGIKVNTISIVLTIISLTVYSMSFNLLSNYGSVDLFDYVKGIVAYSMIFSIQIYPTPGGSGFFEYAMSILYDPKIVAIWRLAYILVSTIPAIVFMILLLKLRKIFEENLKKSIF